ncbi:AaceriAGL127Cp [[Ashbya] aceris (nom. inval.)]|nr:AaceriAGL127Cp [[Ashbya] aceris (nom. inval.)]
MSVEGKNVDSYSGLIASVQHEHSHPVHNRGGSLESTTQHAFIAVASQLKPDLKGEDDEHNLELELHKFLSQHNHGPPSSGTTGTTLAGIPDFSTSHSISHRDEMAEAIEKAMAEIACPELWSNDHSSAGATVGGDVHLDTLTMDGILGNEEPFVQVHEGTLGCVDMEGQRYPHGRNSISSIVGSKAIIQQSMDTHPAAQTGARSRQSSEEADLHICATPNGKRKNAGVASSQATVKRSRLFYETISPESLSPLSDNSDFLKAMDTKGSAVQNVPISTSVAAGALGHGTKNMKGYQSASKINIGSNIPKEKLQVHSTPPVVSILPEKLTQEFTMQQVMETKRRIINTHKLILNFNFLKESYTRSCSELKRTVFKLKESECHRARLAKENEQLKRLVLELNERMKNPSK